MKKNIIIVTILMLVSSLFAGCTPSEYTKGVEIDEEYPDGILEIYDDAVVFESEARFDKVKLTLGTKDDLEDIIEYFQDYYEYKKITPTSEQEDKDEYAATFTVEGYEFEIEVSEADGKYLEDLFEYIIEISSKKLDNSSASASDASSVDASATDSSGSATNAEDPDDDPAMNSDDTPPVEATAEPTQKSNLPDETSLSNVATGAWYSYTGLNGDGANEYVDYTIYFADDTSGSYHYFDYATSEKMDNEFTYEIVNGVLVLNLDNNVQLLYDAYYDNNQLHLINQYTGSSMYMMNWNKESGMTPNLTDFTAYGCWISIDSRYNAPVILSMWEGGNGYVLNWMNDGSSDNMMWKEEGSSMSFEVGMLYGEKLTLDHRGNVLIATLDSGDVMYFYRATVNALAGVYEVTESSNGEVGTWVATLNYDGTATHKISSGRLTFNYDNSDWYINPIDGKLYAFIFGDYASFNYYYNESVMKLHDSTDNFDYTFDKTQ